MPANRLRVSRTRGSAGFMAMELGNLTRSGVRVPAAAQGNVSAITAGNDDGHFQVTSSEIVVSAGGQGNLTGVYTLTVSLTTGESMVYQITIDTGAGGLGCYDIRTTANYTAITTPIGSALIAAPNGRTIALGADQELDTLLRGGFGVDPYRRTSFSTAPLVFKSRDVANPGVITGGILELTAYIEFYDLLFKPTVWTKATVTAATPTVILSTSSSLGLKATGWVFDNCHCTATLTDPNADLSGNNTYTVGTGDGSNKTFTIAADALPYLPMAYANQMTGNSPANPSPAVITAGAITATAQANTGTAGSPTVNFSGTGVTSGTINLTTGAATVTFDTAPANGVPVTLAYKVLGTYMNLLLGGAKEFIATNESGLYIDNITIRDCSSSFCESLINITPFASTVTGCTASGFYTIGLKWNTPPGANNNHTVSDITTYWPTGLSTDNGNPHADHLVFIATPTLAYDSVMSVTNWLAFNGGSRGQVAGLAWRDYNTSATGGYTLTLTNILVGGFNVVAAVSISNPNNCTLDQITGVGRNEVADSGTVIGLYGTRRGTNAISNSVTEAFDSTGATGPAPTFTNCLSLGHAGATVPYDDVFVGPDYDSQQIGYDRVHMLINFALDPGVTTGANTAAFA